MSANNSSTPEQWVHFEDAAEAKGYAMISNVVMRDGALSMEAKYLYGLLKSYAWQDPSTYPGVKTLCRAAGVSNHTLGKYLKELIAADLIGVKRRGQGKTNLYTFKMLSHRYGPDGHTSSRPEMNMGSHQDGDTGSHNEDSVDNTQVTNSRKGAPASPDASAKVMKNPGKYYADILEQAGKEPTDRERERCFPHLMKLITKHNATRVEMEKVIGKAFEARMGGYDWWPLDTLTKLRQANVTPLRAVQDKPPQEGGGLEKLSDKMARLGVPS